MTVEGTKVKICGLRRPEDVAYVNAAGADYAGFVFYPKSRRNVSIAQAEQLMNQLDANVQAVAVCVSPSRELYEQLCQLHPDIIQIHGEIPQIALDAGGIPLWQAVNLKSAGSLSEVLIHHPKITGYVIDGADYGSGKTFGWEHDTQMAEQLRGQLREEMKDCDLILAGGLNIGNIETGLRIFRPDVADVSSGVETDGWKEKEKIKEFVRKVKQS